MPYVGISPYLIPFEMEQGWFDVCFEISHVLTKRGCSDWKNKKASDFSSLSQFLQLILWHLLWLHPMSRMETLLVVAARQRGVASQPCSTNSIPMERQSSSKTPWGSLGTQPALSPRWAGMHEHPAGSHPCCSSSWAPHAACSAISFSL